MKRGIKTLLLLGLFSPLIVNAASVTMDCPTTAKAGTDVTCSIKLTSEESVDGFEAKINTSSGLTYKAYTRASGWSGNSSNSTFLIYGYVDEEENRGVKGDNITLGTYKYTVGSTAIGNLTVTLSDIIVSNLDGEPLSSTQTASDTIRVMSTINTLSSITIDEETIEEFSSSVNEYEIILNTNKNNVNIGITKTDNNSKVVGDIGNKELKYGINKFVIIVTSEIGEENKYILLIDRPEVRQLNGLVINNEKLKLEEGTYEYLLTVENDTTSIDILATLQNENLSSFVENYGPRTIEELKEGNNEILIKIQDEYEEELIYKVIINRLDKNGNDVSIPNPDTGDMNMFLGVAITIGLMLLAVISIKKVRRS